MSEATILDALAEAAEAAATALRRHAARLRTGTQPGDSSPGSAAERARQIHPMLGPRQAEVLSLLEAAGSDGTTTGAIAAALNYDQPNVHITLGALADRGLAEKDTSAYPHIYRLGPALRDDAA